MIKIDENQDKDVTYENEPESQRQLFPNIPLTVDVSPLQDAIDDLDDRMDDVESDIDSIMTTLQSFDGQPGVAETVSDMTDTNKIYVYVGSETGYTSGDWYYYDGTAWVSGGAYVANPVQIDDTLTQSGEAADAKATGDEIAQIKSDFVEVNDFTVGNLFDKSTAIDNKRIGTNGVVVDDATGYFASDFIAVEPSARYFKNSPVENAYHRVAFYNANKTYVGDSTSRIFTTNNNTRYMRFSGVLSEKNDTVLFKVPANKDVLEKNSVFLPDMRNGIPSDQANAQQVCSTHIIPYGKSDFLTIIINKPVSAAGNYWRVVITTYSVDSGYPDNNSANIVTDPFAIDSEKVIVAKGLFDAASVGFAFALAEKQPNGTVVNHRIGDFSDGDIVIARGYKREYNLAYEYEGEISIRKKTLDCTPIMTLSKPSGITQVFQGIAVYGDKLLQEFNDGKWALYDLATQNNTAEASGTLEGATSALHCNTCCFGSKYNVDDAYPLLYSTGGVAGTLNPSGVNDNAYCVVHRFVEENNVLTAKLIQHIYVDQSDFAEAGYHANYGGGNFVVENGFIYEFSALYRTNGSQEAHDNENRFVVHKYAVPSTSEAVVTLTADDVIEEYLFLYDTWFMQGATMHDGVIYHTFGMGSHVGDASSNPKDNAIRAYNMVSGIETAKIDGTILPYKTQEPEGLAVYNNMLLANTGTGKVYALTF